MRSTSRHSDTPLISTLRDKRWVFFVVHAWNALTDQRDLQRMTIQSVNAYAQAVRSPNR